MNNDRIFSLYIVPIIIVQNTTIKKPLLLPNVTEFRSTTLLMKTTKITDKRVAKYKKNNIIGHYTIMHKKKG